MENNIIITSKFGQEGFETTQKHDKIKNEYCKNNNIHLLRLTYDDLFNNMIEWILDDEIGKITTEKGVFQI